MVTPMRIHAIPAFTDNYIWALWEDRTAVLVDPGDAAPALQFLATQALNLGAVLITHHHPDHVGGLPALLRQHPAPVYGPRAEASRVPQINRPLDDGDRIELLGRRFTVLAVPGHTLGHIAYHAAGDSTHDEAGVLLCGDTLFSAGCGRLFEGTPQQMHASLQRLNALQGDTRVCCTHEYTLSNLAFAVAVEPDNADIRGWLVEVRQLRSMGLPSLPSTLALERRSNPFLRCAEPTVRDAVCAWAGAAPADEAAVFAALRQWKDGFRAPP